MSAMSPLLSQIRERGASVMWVSALALGALALVGSASLARETVTDGAVNLTYDPASFSSRAPSAPDCRACHQFDPVLSHPDGVSVRAGVAPELPRENGKMTCLTCHSATTHGTGARAGPMLRAGGVAGLCAACHDAGESNSAGMHARGLGRAHLASPNGVRMPLRAEPDDGTQSCVVCHDGTIAGDGSAGIGRDPLSRDSGEHPVGIPYRSSRTDDSAVRLVPLDRLNARVRLFDRQVGCGSCHSVYSGERALLVRSNLNSQLCASCHME